MTWVSLGFWPKGFGWLDLQEAGKVCQLNEKTAYTHITSEQP